jgi:phosphatidylglycerophosphatase A
VSKGGDKVKKLLVTGLGTGYLPIAPGTWGSAAVAAIFVAVAYFTPGAYVYAVPATMLAIAMVSSVICVVLGPFTERAFGKKDPGACTIDEWAGQAVTLLGATYCCGKLPQILIAAGTGFVVFRIFDILKPPPIRSMEVMKHGWGVLCDDLVAGVYGYVVVWALLSFTPLGSLGI